MVFQYTPVALILALVADVTLKTNVYCQNSNSVHFSHIWVWRLFQDLKCATFPLIVLQTTVIKIISVAFAAIAAISFTLRLRSVLGEKKILQKLFALKAIISLETIQNVSLK